MYNAPNMPRNACVRAIEYAARPKGRPAAHKGGAGAIPRRGGGGRSLPAPPPNHPGESHERIMGSKVPVGSRKVPVGLGPYGDSVT